MNEAETRAEHIDPALKAAGWGVVEGSKILREYPITPGRIEGQGKRDNPLPPTPPSPIASYFPTFLAKTISVTPSSKLTLYPAWAPSTARSSTARWIQSSFSSWQETKSQRA